MQKRNSSKENKLKIFEKAPNNIPYSMSWKKQRVLPSPIVVEIGCFKDICIFSIFFLFVNLSSRLNVDLNIHSIERISNKSCSALNSLYKSQWAHVSIFHRNKGGGAPKVQNVEILLRCKSLKPPSFPPKRWRCASTDFMVENSNFFLISSIQRVTFSHEDKFIPRKSWKKKTILGAS